MRTLRSRLALVLLLCFARVLLPDAWVLALHTHEHTTEEPTQSVKWPKGKALLSAKHQHCDVDQFFKEAFQTPEPLVLPVELSSYSSVAAASTLPAGVAAFTPTTGLRGPPSLS
ncbi:hypothetical protein HMJ29_08970 [Hymenobacter taeanensis]|uniref:Uncharacterized protein n=1 Tax=Hymenobacter taeanensis TaxID=2735321 RepID=A0A6M6BGD4_9BACT|nr:MULTISPECIES: hypothetical protein [Hymenobacter]QJX47059.1 hypothetical protein HMJ29_08970 [Hymenobacter taeanensis]UOQ80937.1 hypothetical protein MUN83_19335 [Hymenobacter sp. 5414T-23]